MSIINFIILGTEQKINAVLEIETHVLVLEVQMQRAAHVHEKIVQCHQLAHHKLPMQ